MKLVELAYFSDQVPEMADFYRRLLGAEPVYEGDGIAIFLLGGTKIFIHHKYEVEAGDLPPEDHIALETEDIESACQKLLDQGARLEVPPKDYYWGRSAYLRDADGRLIEIIQAAEG